VATAYRRLAVLIELARPPRRTLLVVSPSPGDGRTSVVHHLARELGRPGVTVTVVTTADAGADAEAFADGPPPPGHVVLVDTPPLLGSPDALRMAAGADAILVVARRGHTRLADLTRAADLLTTVGTPPTAAILLDASS
jgi:Mrp family chromosome partitioning ATPase